MRPANTTWPASSWARPSATRCSPGRRIRAGDVLLGLPSNGLHTNGYSLARKLLFEVAGLRLPPCCRNGRHGGRCAAAACIAVTLKPIRALAEQGCCAARRTSPAAASPTTRRACCPRGWPRRSIPAAWTIPPIFELLRRLGNIPEDDYRRTFNLGIGMILAVPAADSCGAPNAVLARAGRAARIDSGRWYRKSAADRGWCTDEAPRHSALRPRLEFRSHRR